MPGCSLVLIKKEKSDFYLSETTKNPNDPKTFWDVVRSVSGAMSYDELPKFLVKYSVNLTDKCAVRSYFDDHLITAGNLFCSLNGDFESTTLNNEPAVLSNY